MTFASRDTGIGHDLPAPGGADRADRSTEQYTPTLTEISVYDSGDQAGT